MKAKTKFYLLIAIFQVFLIFIVLSSVNGLVSFAAAQGGGTISDPTTISVLAISAAISVSASVMASAIALKTVGTAAISSLSEREESFFKAFLVAALCEALAIYGLIVGILLWTKIP